MAALVLVGCSGARTSQRAVPSGSDASGRPMVHRERRVEKAGEGRSAAVVPSTIIRKGKGLLLNIRARRQAPQSPKSGWCGETAIQEALLHHGAFYPQRKINRAGRPSHPDLYASDIPRALTALRVSYTRYPWAVRGFARFHQWLKKQLGAAVPVLAGMKIHPTSHPRWGLDHFVLVKGFDPKHLTVNTTWGRAETRSLVQLQSKTKGLSFKNRYDRYFGIAIRGLRGRTGRDRPVRLFVQHETTTRMKVKVKCEGLEPKGSYRLDRYAAHDARKPLSTVRFVAKGRAYVVTDTLDKRKPTIFRCRPAR